MAQEKSDPKQVPPPPSERPRDGTPGNAKTAGKPADPAPRRPDPTRYGDWEKNGRCIDF